MDRANVYRAPASSPEQPMSACLLCGSEHAADGMCPSCGVAMPRLVCACGAVDGVSATRCRRCGGALAEAPLRSTACPRCAAPLLEVGLDTTTSAHVCTSCRGLFVAPRAWLLLCSRDDLVESVARHFPPVAASTAAALELFACPVCGEPMERVRFSATSMVVVDACMAQHGVWLDGGELSAAVSYAKHRRQLTQGDALAEAERIERELTGYDAGAVRRDLDALAVANLDTPRLLREVRLSRPRLEGWSLAAVLFAVLVLVVLLFGPRL